MQVGSGNSFDTCRSANTGRARRLHTTTIGMGQRPSSEPSLPSVSKRSETEKPSNTIAQRIRKLAADGYGHEDIVVLLRADGLRISQNGKERIRQMVLNARRPRSRGLERGRKAAG